MAIRDSAPTARDIAASMIRALRRDFVGRREPTDDDWEEAIEAVLKKHIEPDDRYQDGYDDGYDAGYEDAEDEDRRERNRLREKKRGERAEAKASKTVIKVRS